MSISKSLNNKNEPQHIIIKKIQKEDKVLIAFIRMALGGIASMISGGITHPIDTVKVRLQKEGELGKHDGRKKYKNIINCFKVIIKEEGFFALYKGLIMSLIREATYSAILLGLYEPYREFLGGQDANTTPFWKKLLAGFFSGATGAIFATPLDLIKIRLQSHSQTHKKVNIEIKRIIKNAGFRGFFKGIFPNIARGSILTATKMSTYDQSKRIVINKLELQDGRKVHFICSFITGFALSITTSPIDLIKTRIMSQSYKNQNYTGIYDCFKQTFKTEGILGFYKGFIPQWCRFGPFNVIQLMTWEYLRQLCGLKTL